MKSTMPQPKTGRICQLAIWAGANGTGKTTCCIEMFKQLSQKRPVLFVHIGVEDTFDMYRKINITTPKHNLQPGMYSIIVSENTQTIAETIKVKGGKPLTKAVERDIFYYVLNNLYNCFVVFDDVRNYIGSNIPKSFEQLLIQRRQKMLDLHFIAHGLTLVPPAVYSYWNTIYLFKTAETLERAKAKIPQYERIQSSQTAVNASKYNNAFIVLKR